MAVVVSFALTTAAAAEADPTFSAHGSAEQVYVTGLGAHEKMTLLDRHGHAVQTKKADSLGGRLFRNVKPGSGYRVRAPGGTKSDALTVLSTRPAPPSTGVYNQTIAPSGYQHLTPRDGTKLAMDVPPPQDVSSVLPTGP